jgi:hypothetical protein
MHHEVERRDRSSDMLSFIYMHIFKLTQRLAHIQLSTLNHNLANIASTGMSTIEKYWLLKAEPDSRVVKGKDVKVCLPTVNSKWADLICFILAVQRGRL